MAAQLFEVCEAIGSGWHRFHRVAADDRRGRIGAVRGVRDEHFLARISPFSQCRANHHQTGHLALGAGRRLSGHFRKPGYLSKTPFDAEDYFKRTLSERRGSERMEIGEAVDTSDLLVDPRVVLHRTRA